MARQYNQHEWRNNIWTATQEINVKNKGEKDHKDEQNCHYEAKQIHCSFDGCSFSTISCESYKPPEAEHGQSLTGQCQYMCCHQTFHKQDLHNHSHPFDIAYSNLGLHSFSLK